jgi:DNA-binding transcriptional regulator YhcF (GntR family)
MNPGPAQRRQQRQLLSEEVRQQLAQELTNGTYAPNEKLPSEPEFAKRYGISRPTLREILSGLERDGLIRRVHGVGTFVTLKQTRVHSVLDLDIGVTEAVTAAGANLNVEVVESRVGPIREWISTALELPKDTEAFRVERVISVEGSPDSYEYAVQNVPRNVKTVAAPVESWVRDMPGADFIFLDPPRTGARRNVIDAVGEKAREMICFLSCDPVTFARDASRLIASGWRLATLDLLDLFPNSHHVETLSSLVRAR